MKVTSDVRCNGCGFTTKARFVRPGFIKPTIGTVECKACKSQIAFRADRVGSTKSGTVQMRATVFKASAELVAMTEAEEAQLRDEDMKNEKPLVQE